MSRLCTLLFMVTTRVKITADHSIFFCIQTEDSSAQTYVVGWYGNVKNVYVLMMWHSSFNIDWSVLLLKLLKWASYNLLFTAIWKWLLFLYIHIYVPWIVCKFIYVCLNTKFRRKKKVSFFVRWFMFWSPVVSVLSVSHATLCTHWIVNRWLWRVKVSEASNQQLYSGQNSIGWDLKYKKEKQGWRTKIKFNSKQNSWHDHTCFYTNVGQWRND